MVALRYNNRSNVNSGPGASLLSELPVSFTDGRNFLLPNFAVLSLAYPVPVVKDILRQAFVFADAYPVLQSLPDHGLNVLDYLLGQ